MEHNSQAGNSLTRETSDGWGSMGGGPGDGIVGQSTLSYGVTSTMGTAPGTYNQGYGIPQTPQQQQQPQYPVYTPGSGSITRFATTPEAQQQQPHPYNEVVGNQPADSGSYAARSAQAYAHYQPAPQPPVGMAPLPQQQQQQQQPTVPGGSYAARSAQAYVSQGMQPNYFTPGMGVPSPGMTAASVVSSGGSFAERSAQAYAPQQQQQQQAYYNNNPGYGGYPDPAVQPYGAPPPAPAPAAPMSSGSYMARSAQAYGTAAAVNQVGTSLPPTIRPPGVAAGPPPGSYTARAAQAYGIPQQQQQISPQFTSQQQQPMMVPSSMGGGASPYAGQQQAYPPPTSGQQQQQQPQPIQQAMFGQQQQQQPGMMPPTMGQPAIVMPMNMPSGGGVPSMGGSVVGAVSQGSDPSHVQVIQQRLLTDATRKIQEHAYYMRQAMQQNNLPVVLDRAAHMIGELGGPPHGHHQQQPGGTSGGGPTNSGASSKLTPKNYYELYMRAVEDLPHFEDYLLSVARGPVVPPNSIQIVESRPHVQRKPFTMRELYDSVQYCPRVLSRLYLQITAGSALIRSGEASAKWVMNDLVESVRCEQNPIRGLFLRHYLLTALRDKLPDTPPPPATPHATAGKPPAPETTEATDETKTELEVDVIPEEKEPGTVKESYRFILANFMEMNKLWVRIQHLPGEGKNKQAQKRRERERNELRILVGTNLVRLSQLECVTSKIYGEEILQQILDHIVTCGDPLSQAYLMDCLVQAFPDEYHIETLHILLHVCPRLRDKVNIRTILQGLMDRLANYLAEDELLDESDTNQVKREVARDSFGLFEECVQNVYNARGPKLTSREVIRLQTALLQFSVKCYPGNLVQIGRCVGVCVSALRQASASYEIPDGTIAAVPHDKLAIKALDEVAVAELEKLLSIPLDTLALECLNIEHYGDLIGFLPWSNRRGLAITVLKSVEKSGSIPKSAKELDELFTVIEPVLRDNPSAGMAAVRSEPPTGLTNMTYNLGGVHIAPNTAYGGVIPERHLPNMKDVDEENSLVSKLVHMIDHKDNNVLYEFLNVARKHIQTGESYRRSQTLIALVFAYLRLARRVLDQDHEDQTPTEKRDMQSTSNTEPADPDENGKEKEVSTAEHDGTTNGAEAEPAEGVAGKEEGGKSEIDGKDDAPLEPDDALQVKGPAVDDFPSDSISCRQVFVVIQEAITEIVAGNAERGFKIYLDVALTADRFAALAQSSRADYASIAHELFTQALGLYEESITDAKTQQRCVESLIGALLTSTSISSYDYECLITRTTQFAAKSLKKSDQCQLVALCAQLFYPVGDVEKYSNPQRSLECLQRSLKLADSCTAANPADIFLFVELLEHYLFFFEKKNPAITSAYISGLVALIKEHFANSVGADAAVIEAKEQFLETMRYIKQKKSEEATSELFGAIQMDVVGV